MLLKIYEAFNEKAGAYNIASFKVQEVDLLCIEDRNKIIFAKLRMSTGYI